MTRAVESAAVAHRYMTREEAAKTMRVSVATIKRAVYDGSLKSKRLGPEGKGPYRFRQDWLDEWFEGLVDG